MGAKDGILLPFEGAEVTTTEFDESVFPNKQIYA